MKITKYPQSHLVIEKEGKKLIIDPGYLTAKAGFAPTQFQGADLYLITHQHGDHLDPENIKEIVQDAPVYGNSDVIEKLKELGVEGGVEMKNLEEAEVEGFKIQAVDIAHFPPPNGSTPPPNTGFLIDGILFHSGDGEKLTEEGIHSHNAALALGMPSTSEVSIANVKKMLKKLNAKVYIPIHYSAYPADPNDHIAELGKEGIEVKILEDEQSLDIESDSENK